MGRPLPLAISLLAGLALTACNGVLSGGGGSSGGTFSPFSAHNHGAGLIHSDFGQHAKFLGLPRNNPAHNFEYVVSCPILFPGESYRGGSRQRAIYMLYRNKSKTRGYTVHLVQRPVALQTDKFSGFPGWLSNWDEVKGPLLNVDGAPVGHQGMAFKGAIHVGFRQITFTDGESRSKVGKLRIYDLKCLTRDSNNDNCLLREMRVDKVPNYQGPDGAGVSLTRVTYDSLKQEVGRQKFFDSYRGRAIAAYECHRKYNNRDDPDHCPHGAGIFIQEYIYDPQDHSVRFGHPIRLYRANIDAIDGVAQLSGAQLLAQMAAGQHTDRAGLPVTNWFHQNTTVSSIGNESFVLSFVYNSVLEDAARPTRRDFPTYASFIKYTKAFKWLNRARNTGGLVDLSDDFYYSDAALRSAALTRSGGPEDQAALWSNQFFVHPSLPGKAFSFYESWGSLHNQPARTADRSIYPGTVMRYITRSSTHLGQSCHSYCAGLTLYGPKCLSLELFGGDRHGQELNMHKRSLPFSTLFGMFPDAEALAVQCSDIGTSVDTDSDDLRIVKYRFTDAVTSTPYLLGRDICEDAGHRGVIFMEKQRPLAVAGVSRHLTGKTLLKYHSYSFSAGEWVTVGCSTRNWSWRFFTRELIDDHRSCKDVCDEAGAGPLGIGLRPYRAELSARSTGGEASYLSHINVGVHMNRDMFAVKHGLWKDRWFDSSGGVVKRSSASPAGVRLRCVCGPGQSLDGKMVFRRFDHAWD